MEETAQEHRAAGRPRLSVFCVSAWDAHCLEGRFPHDRGAATFSSLADTGIPALRAHVQQLARTARTERLRTLVTDLSHFIAGAGSALMIQPGDDGWRERAASVRHTCTGAVEQLQSHTTSKLQALRSVLEKEWLGEGLDPRLVTGVAQAVAAAESKLAGWSKLPWTSYRAVIRRNGAFSSGRMGQVDFNAELAGPLQDAIAINWDNIFNVGFKAHRDALLEAVEAQVQALADCLLTQLVVPELPEERRLEIQQLVEEACSHAHAAFSAALQKVSVYVAEQHRGISRHAMSRKVREKMLSAYRKCSSETGKGVYCRMKDIMAKHVDQRKASMFKLASDELRERVRGTLSEVMGQLEGARSHLATACTTRLARLWRVPPSNHHERYEAAVQLQELADACGALCSVMEVDVAQPFTLPPRPATRDRVPHEGEQATGSGALTLALAVPASDAGQHEAAQACQYG
mmetsp:Transcript_19385/g.41956  ORF Transcript_19385/g.41956 Transcript_19385/m.41956 type:complete len:461 (+) Transcript_19385:1360-2742(+)